MMTDDPKYFIVWPVCSGAGQSDLLDPFTPQPQQHHHHH